MATSPASLRPPRARRTGSHRTPAEATGARRRRPDPLTVAVTLIVGTFALYGIGSPLVGHAVFGGTDLLGALSMYKDAGLAGTAPHTINLGDTIDAAVPNAALFGQALRHGDFAGWNPYQLGGSPLGSTPNYAMLSPLSLPFWFLPAQLALGYAKLLEIICSVGGSLLYLRRVRLGRPAALLGGLAFAASGYLVAWTGWPQTKVGALVPAFFWGLEGLIQTRRPRAVVLVALSVTGMLLGGFPSVTLYALITGAGYLVVRVGLEYPGQWRRMAGVLAAGLGGVVAGVTLAAAQLVPWARFMSHALITGRVYESQGHIPFAALVTTIAPYALGSANPAAPPTWFGPRVFIEEVAYVGAAAGLLILVTLLQLPRARTVLPAGALGAVLAGAAGWAVLIFVGGPPLWLLQRSSALFAQNFIGRARGVLGFLLAVLAAVGFELLLRGDPHRRAPARRWWPAAVLTAAGATGLVAYLLARRWAGPHLPYLNRQLAVGLLYLGGAAVCAGWLWWGPRPNRGRVRLRRVAWLLAAVGIPALLGAQGLVLARAYYPRSAPATFYPLTGGEAYLRAHLGHQRYFGPPGGVYGGTGALHDLRGLQGHAFVDRRLGELLEALPGQQFRTPPTSVSLDNQGGAVLRSPILDRLAVSYYVVPQDVVPYGQSQVDRGDGSAVTVHPGQSVRAPVTGTGPPRGVGFIPRGRLPATAGITVTLSDATGATLARATRRTWSMGLGTPFYVPLAVNRLDAPGPYTVDLALAGGTPWTVAGRAGRPAVSTVRPIEDGLRLVSADGAAVYQRLTALPRARWASTVVIAPDPVVGLRMLADGTVGPDQVLLDGPGPAASGQPATVRWLTDGLDTLALSVQAAGRGYLVLADALRTGWSTTVDGHRARLVPADHGLVAVAVPAGRHIVRLAYTDADGGRLGSVLSGLTGCVLLGLTLADRRRRAGPRPPAALPGPRRTDPGARPAISRGRLPRQ